MDAERTRRRRRDRLRLESLRESVAARLWPVPVAAIVVAVGLGIAIPMIDRAVDASVPPVLAAALFSGGSGAARAVLSAIAGSLVSATTLTFSLTVVALQLASTQASPRVLRMFARDRVVHRTLAVFLGTFAFALTVLRTVRDAADPDPAVVPRIAVTLAFLLTLVSVVMLVLFLSHLARQLRIETVLRDVHDETTATIALVSERADGADLPAPERPGHARRVAAPRSGFLTTVDRQRLLGLASDHDIVIEETRTIGSDVAAGTPLAFWWSHDPVRVAPDDEAEQIGTAVTAAFGLGYERTPTQDIGFGLRQLADIATRALSPGVNDPTTAVHTLGHVAAVLSDLARRPAQPAVWSDDDGVARLVVRTHDFADLVELGIGQARRYGSGDAEVVARLLLLLQEVGWACTSDERRDIVRGQLGRLTATVSLREHDDTERARFARLTTSVEAALDGRWDAPR